jgi:DNA-binding MarR family transcriptional regulator
MTESDDSYSQGRDLRPIENLDPAIHTPARLMILALLAVVERADFTFLLNQTGLSRGNLASHIGRLEEAGYVFVQKSFIDRVPNTTYQLTKEGRIAIVKYRQNMQQVIDTLLK